MSDFTAFIANSFFLFDANILPFCSLPGINTTKEKVKVAWFCEEKETQLTFNIICAADDTR